MTAPKGAGLFKPRPPQPVHDVGAYLARLRGPGDAIADYLAHIEGRLASNPARPGSAALAATVTNELAVFRLHSAQSAPDPLAFCYAGMLLAQAFGHLAANEVWQPAVDSRRASNAAHRANRQRPNQESEIRADHQALARFYTWYTAKRHALKPNHTMRDARAACLRMDAGKALPERTRRRLRRLVNGGETVRPVVKGCRKTGETIRYEDAIRAKE